MIENVHEVKKLLNLEREYLLVIVIQGVKLWLVRMNSDAGNQTIWKWIHHLGTSQEKKLKLGNEYSVETFWRLERHQINQIHLLTSKTIIFKSAMTQLMHTVTCTGLMWWIVVPLEAMQDVGNPVVWSIHYCMHSVRTYLNYLMHKCPDALSFSVQKILTGYLP